MIRNDYFMLSVLFLAAGTLIIRGFFIAIAKNLFISPQIKELFTYIPAAIFPALIVPTSYFHPTSGRLSILLLAGLFCYFIRSTFAVICFGLALLYFYSKL